MFITRLLKRIFSGRRVKKSSTVHHAKPHVTSHSKAHKKSFAKARDKTHAKVKTPSQRRAAGKKLKLKAEAQKPATADFKRTGVNPASAQKNDPAHQPGHRHLDVKKYQETKPVGARRP